MTHRARSSIALFSLCLVACGAPSPGTDAGSDASADQSAPEGTGVVDVRLWGETYVRQRIPATDFEDGWSVEFSRFLLHVANVRVGQPTTPRTIATNNLVVDLKQLTAPTSIGLVTGLAVGPAPAYGFDFAAANADSTAMLATDADLALMKAQRYSLYVEGSAQHPMRGTFSFRWGFTNGTRFAQCRTPAGTQGVLATAAPDATVTHITVHSDHLFLDSLETETAKVRFDAIANADRDNDRDVTLDELAAVQLSSLPMGQYSTGARATVTDLRAFVTALTASMGHLNGEGLCESSAIN